MTRSANDTTGALARAAIQIAFRGAGEYCRAHNLSVDPAALRESIKKWVGRSIDSALDDAKQALDCNMGAVAEQTFAASMMQAGIEAAKEVSGDPLAAVRVNAQAAADDMGQPVLIIDDGLAASPDERIQFCSEASRDILFPHRSKQTVLEKILPKTEEPATEEEDSVFGEVISRYTRAQAIADGVLIDAMQGDFEEVSRQHFKYPIAMTAAVFAIIRKAVENPKHCNDYKGVWHDILWMARGLRGARQDQNLFRVMITGAGRQRLFTFKMVCGPGDTAEPVLTLMLPEED